jgi:hypothetical protein
MTFICVVHAANIASDGSLRLGRPSKASTVGNKQTAPVIWLNGCNSTALWQLVPDPWGVNPDATGSITMIYSGNGSVVTTVNVSNLAQKGVNAYPFIFYGHDPFGYHVDGQPLKFPAQLGSMRSLILELNYSLAMERTPGNLDVAFDEWLIPSPAYTGGAAGAVEIVIAPYFVFDWGAAGKYIGTFTAAISLNDTPTSMAFTVYSTGIGPGYLLTFYPRDEQIASADIRFDLLQFLKAGAAIAGVDDSWYVAGIEFGTEFGHTSSAKYTLTVEKLLIEQNLLQAP